MTEGKKSTVLVVDDDPSGLTFFELSLDKLDYRVLTARSVREAQAQIKRVGIGEIDCVLTDFRMPIQSGLDLLEWVMQRDGGLSTIIITAEGEKNLVRDSLRGGASDYLEKPVTRKTLGEVVARGIEETARQRLLRETGEEVKAAGKMEQIFQVLRAPEIAPFLRSFYRPCHAVGGDFINVLPLGRERYLFLLGDVSGHDVRAAFVSAYFQGMVRGLLLHKDSLQAVFSHFNRILRQEWSSGGGRKAFSSPPLQVSLAVCACVADLVKNELFLLNCGFPPFWICNKDGRCYRSECRNPPLGWLDLNGLEKEKWSTEEGGFLYFNTDGLIDYAAYLDVDSFSLIFKLLSSNKETSEKFISDPPDDILIMRFQLNKNANPEDLFQPIIYERYAGREHADIDHLQEVWRRSLRFALSEELGVRLYDLVLCCREAVINALAYGCEQSKEKHCALEVTYNPGRGVVRVRVDDPGHGHRFDLSDRLNRIDGVDGSHLGLAIIQNLSDGFSLENAGATVVFEFHLRKKKS